MVPSHEASPEQANPRLSGMAGHAARLVAGHGAAASAFGVRIVAAGLAYLLQIVLARALGASAYGTFNFAWNLVTIGGFLATLGFGQIAVRYLAQYQADGANDFAHGFLRAGIGITLAGSLVMAAAGFAFFPLIERGYGLLCCTVLGIGLIALPFFALTDFFEGVARSQGWTIRALVPPYLVRQGALLLVLLGAMAAGRHVDAEFAIAAALGATMLAAIVQVALIAGKTRAAFPPAAPAYAEAEWRKAAIPTLLSDFALLARQNIDLILLGLMAPPAAVGLYFAATRIASLLGLIDFAVGAAFGHRFARATRQESAENPHQPALQGLFAEARRLTFGPGLLAAVVLASAAPVIMMLFGPEFSAALPPALILLAASATRLALGPVEDLLAMAGHPAAVWRANLIGALVMAIACLLLVPMWQASGAAWAVMAGGIASAAMLSIATHRHLGFWPFLARRGSLTP